MYDYEYLNTEATELITMYVGEWRQKKIVI